MDRLQELLVARLVVSHQRAVLDGEAVAPKRQVAGLHVFLVVLGWSWRAASEKRVEKSAVSGGWSDGRGRGRRVGDDG